MLEAGEQDGLVRFVETAMAQVAALLGDFILGAAVVLAILRWGVSFAWRLGFSGR